jgi:hypothetical protein
LHLVSHTGGALNEFVERSWLVADGQSPRREWAISETRNV